MSSTAGHDPNTGGPTSSSETDGRGDPIEAFLASLASGLELPADLRREIVDELGGHLADSVASLEGEGLEHGAAEREALARLGSADALAADLTRAEQTRRRLLAGVGGGIYAAAGSWIGGLIVGWAIATLVLLVGSLLVGAVGHAIGTQLTITTADQSLNTAVIGLADWLAAVLAARAVIQHSSRWSRRSIQRLQPWWALVGGIGLAIWAVFGLVMPQGPLAVAIELGIPVAFVIGALVRVDRPGPRLPARLVGAALLVALLPVVALGAMGGRVDGGVSSVSGLPDLHWDLVGAEATISLGDGRGGSGDGSVEAQVGPAAKVLDGGFRDLRFEAWALPNLDGPPVLDPAHPHPFAVVAAARDGDAFAATLHLERYRDVSAYTLFFTGLGADGRRYRLDALGGGIATFRGSVWDWFTAPSARYPAT